CLFRTCACGRSGGTSTSASSETPTGVIPKIEVGFQVRDGHVDALVTVDRGTISSFPRLCATDASSVTTELGIRFSIDDGVNLPVDVCSMDSWRCLDPSGGNPPPRRPLLVPYPADQAKPSDATFCGLCSRSRD